MKKLELKALNLGASELLTTDKLKNVMGGDGGSALCPSGTFPCYCNSVFRGCAPSVSSCIIVC